LSPEDMERSSLEIPGSFLGCSKTEEIRIPNIPALFEGRCCTRNGIEFFDVNLFHGNKEYTTMSADEERHLYGYLTNCWV
jgi:hypothetical protein